MTVRDGDSLYSDPTKEAYARSINLGGSWAVIRGSVVKVTRLRQLNEATYVARNGEVHKDRAMKIGALA